MSMLLFDFLFLSVTSFKQPVKKFDPNHVTSRVIVTKASIQLPTSYSPIDSSIAGAKRTQDNGTTVIRTPLRLSGLQGRRDIPV